MWDTGLPQLFMLIECDKRGSRNKIQLLYSDEMFSVPDNVYIIGMMNTADRSLAMVDYALRRRFAFFDISPDELTDERLSGIVEYEIIPLLREYWFDDPRKVEECSVKLRNALTW